MRKTFDEPNFEKIYQKLEELNSTVHAPQFTIADRSPIHVVYGGANLFKAETPAKLGKIALKSIETYAANFAEFARAMRLSGAETLPLDDKETIKLEKRLAEDAEKVKAENFAWWFAWTIYQRTIEKLKREPIEDFRIDFEDGYGFRSDEEEDKDALLASDELARAFANGTLPPFCGIRIKSFSPETHRRAIRTLNLFIDNLLEETGSVIPPNFVVTLPKITRIEEVEILCELLDEFEKDGNQDGLEKNSIKVEIMIEMPESIVTDSGEIVLRKLVEAGRGRVNSAHFGAYDYTASFGISGAHQHLRHEACNFARQMMQISLAPLGLRLSDSVTTEMPVPVHKGENLSARQMAENKSAVHKAWRVHFSNVTHSLINGFYQSWDLHPAQLAARYAAVYSFFIETADEQGKRLKGFIAKATKANLTGNTFDDAASAQGLLNFFVRASNCGALTEEEISAAAGLTASELRTNSFLEIMESRNQ